MSTHASAESASPATDRGDRRPWRVGLIGYGYVGRTFHAPLIAATPGLELAAIATRQIDATAALTSRWPGVRVVGEYAALADDPSIDVIVIATPNDSHVPLARAALEAGRHVVIDKPFTVTLDESDALIARAVQQDRLLSVFHNRRWDGDYLTLRRLVAEGAIGEVREMVSRFDRYDPVPRDRWRERDEPGAGLWYDLGPHLVDQALGLFGAPEWVSGETAALRDRSQACDWAQVVLGYPGRRVTLHCTRLSAHAAARFELHGTTGSLHCEGLDVQEEQLKAGVEPGALEWGEDLRPVWLTTGVPDPRSAAARTVTPLPRDRGDYRAYYRGVVAALDGTAPNPVPAAEARRVMAVLDTAVRSAAEARRLPFIDTAEAMTPPR